MRVAKEITQLAMALEVGYTDGAHISKIEHGRAELPLKVARVIDKAYGGTSLGVSFSDLVEALMHAEHLRRQPRPPATDYQLFLASPMAATKDEQAYQAERKFARDAARMFEDHCGVTVYYAGDKIESRDEFEVPEIAARQNFKALATCDYFVLLALAEGGTRPSSIWVEAGFALGSKIPTLLLARDSDVLPFILETISQHNLHGLLPPVIYHAVDSHADALRLIRIQGKVLLDELTDRAERNAG